MKSYVVISLRSHCEYLQWHYRSKSSCRHYTEKIAETFVNPEVTVWSLKYLQQLHSQKKGSLPDTLAIGYISHRYQIVINV